MRSFLRLTTLVASVLVTAWAVPGCSSRRRQPAGKMEAGKADGPGRRWASRMARWTAPWTRARWRRRHGQRQDGSGAMDKGKMDGAMDKGKMEGPSK